jgi:hypothetical protein
MWAIQQIPEYYLRIMKNQSKAKVTLLYLTFNKMKKTHKKRFSSSKILKILP